MNDMRSYMASGFWNNGVCDAVSAKIETVSSGQSAGCNRVSGGIHLLHSDGRASRTTRLLRRVDTV